MNPRFWSEPQGKPWLKTDSDIFACRDNLQDIVIPFNTVEQAAAARRSIMSYAEYDEQSAVHPPLALRRIQGLGFAAALAGPSNIPSAVDLNVPANDEIMEVMTEDALRHVMSIVR